MMDASTILNVNNKWAQYKEIEIFFNIVQYNNKFEIESAYIKLCNIYCAFIYCYHLCIWYIIKK